jgi:cold shock CspA family protein
MRFQGKSSSWKDGQGFGFVVQNGGGERFLHFKAFESRTWRPVEGDLITRSNNQAEIS